MLKLPQDGLLLEVWKPSNVHCFASNVYQIVGFLKCKEVAATLVWGKAME